MKLKYNVLIAALSVSAVSAANIDVVGTRTNTAPTAAVYAANNYSKPSFVSTNGGVDGGLGTNIIVVHDDANLDGDGNPKTVTWTSNNVYFVRDKLFIPRGTTLTIQPGTTIYGSINNNTTTSLKTDDAVGAITACRGGKLIADGTAAQPIVFTSDRVWEVANNAVSPISPDANIGPAPTSADAGLWGGIVMLGQAYVSSVDASGVNTPTLQIEGFAPSSSATYDDPSVSIPDATQYGSSTNFARNDADNSGTVRYVSIQHGGYEFAAAKEINGLTLGGVGSGTIIEFVEVYANQDDGIEFFGGTVDTKNLVMAFNQDDSFDIDESFNGTNQFWFVIQNPGIADAGGEWDGVGGTAAGYNLGDSLANQSNPKIYNATFVGPGRTNTLSQLPITSGTVNWEKGNNAMNIEDRFAGEIYNSVFDDFAGELIRYIDNAPSVGNKFRFKNNTVGRFGSVAIPQIEIATLNMGTGATPAASGGTLVVGVTVGAAAKVDVNVTITAGDTIDVVAGKIATAVLGVSGITGNYTILTAPAVQSTGDIRYAIGLTESIAGTQDLNLNINIGALAGAGISAAASSANTQTAASNMVTVGVNTSYLSTTFAATAAVAGPPYQISSPGSSLYNDLGAPIEGNTAGNTDPLFTTYTRNGSGALTAINPSPATGSPLLNASLTGPTTVTYRGAFAPGANGNWAAGWTKLSTSGVLLGGAVLPAIVDADNDGISDTLEGTAALTALGFATGVDNVSNHGGVAGTNLFSSIYTAASILNLRTTAGVTVQKTSAATNNVTLTVPVQRSIGLDEWEDAGVMTLPAFTGAAGKEFYRLEVQDAN